MNLNKALGLEKPLILASGSPRRADILKLAGFDFTVRVSDLDEDKEKYLIPEVHVLDLAQKKADKVAETIEDGLVIGADTIVVLEQETLGKPKNARHAKEMLHRLSGRTHTVYTGLALVDKPSSRTYSDYEKTQVHFRELSDSEIDQYVATGSPLDKAGAYGIQDQGAIFVSKVDGCFYTVMGFPIAKFYTTLQKFLKQVA